MTFTFEQILVMGAIASLLTSAISWLIEVGAPWFLKVTKIKVDASIDLGRWIKTVIVGLVSFGLAEWWYPASLPVFPALAGDFMGEVGAVVNWLGLVGAALTPYIGSAMAIYNLILSYITDPTKRQQLFMSLVKLLFPNGVPSSIISAIIAQNEPKEPPVMK